MRYKSIDRDILIKEIPYTILYLEQKEFLLKKSGIGLYIRDTDHRYCSIRLGYEPIDDAVSYFEIEKRLKEGNIEKEIREYLGAHCCKCGKEIPKVGDDINYKPYRIDDYEFPLNCLCEDCSVKENEGFYEYIIYQIKKQSEDKLYKAQRIKMKLKTKLGNFIYRFADEVIFENEKFYCLSKFDLENKEEVLIVGMDLGLRDVNDERVYEGDVLLAEKKDGGLFWGMVKKKKGFFDGKDYVLIHGWNQFYSSLSWATKFKIIGSVGTIKNFDGDEVSDRHYEIWCEENKDFLENMQNRF